MEWLLGIVILMFVFAYLIEKATNFLKQLKDSSSGKLLSSGKNINIALQISTSDKKSEVCASDTDSNTNSIDKGS